MSEIRQMQAEQERRKQELIREIRRKVRKEPRMALLIIEGLMHRLDAGDIEDLLE